MSAQWTVDEAGKKLTEVNKLHNWEHLIQHGGGLRKPLGKSLKSDI